MSWANRIVPILWKMSDADPADIDRFGCVLLPDEPEHFADGFDQNVEFAEPAEGGSGSWFNKVEGKRMLRLWGLSLGMTLWANLSNLRFSRH